MNGLIAGVVWSATIAVAQAPDCNGNGVPDDIDLGVKTSRSLRASDQTMAKVVIDQPKSPPKRTQRPGIGGAARHAAEGKACADDSAQAP